MTGLLSLAFALLPAASNVTATSVIQAQVDPVIRRLPLVEGKGIRFTRISTENGLSQTRVSQILQDDRGFMWFGTQYGLNRYDGYNFKVFVHEPQQSNSIADVYIKALFKDRSGMLWIGTHQSLDRLDPRTESFTHYRLDLKDPADSAVTIVDISQDQAGRLWLATGVGLYGFDPISGKVTRHYRHDPGDLASLPADDVRWTGEDKAGTFWVATNQGLDAFDPDTGHVTLHIPLDEFVQTSFYEDRFGSFWILHHSGSGLATFDRKTNRLTRYSFYEKEPPKGAPTGVTGMLEDRAGNLWIGSDGAGLLRFDREHQRFIRYKNNPGDLQTLAEDKVICLYKDREGNIWTGLHSKGPNHFDPSPPVFEQIRHEPGNPNSPDVDFVNAIYEDHEGILWIGTDSALSRVDRKTGEYSRFTGGLGNRPVIITINEDSSGNLWAGTFGNGLNRFDRRSGRFTTYRHNPADPSSLSNDEVHNLFVDHAGNLWVCTDDGLDRFDPETGKFKVYKVDPRNRRSQGFLSIAEDRYGRFWIGSGFSGLHYFDPASGRFLVYKANPADPRSLQNNDVTSVRMLDADTVWAGTQNGLERLDLKTHIFTGYDHRDGLPANAIGCILTDSRNTLWISTTQGLSNFDPLTKTFRNYSAADGLPGNDLTGWLTCFKSRSGEMFFAGFAGATVFRPENVKVNSQAPGVVLTDFRLSGVPVKVGGDSPLQESISYTNRLTLSHERSAFSLTFSSLSYSNPASIRYRYRLEGLDETWREVGTDERLAAYTALPAGSYTFRVQSATPAGVWSNPGAALTIEILPPLWRTKWFLTACGVCILAALWALYQARLRQIAYQFNLRLDERVSERTRIARELHDTLLQSFQGLVLRFQAVQNMLPERPHAARESLEIAIERAAEAITEGRDAVQQLRASSTGNKDLVETLTALGHDLRANHTQSDNAGVLASFHVLLEGKPRQVSPLLRDDLYRIAREAVGNAYRHSKADRIELELRYDEQMLRLRIRDDGIGIEPALLALGGREGHWGLPGMRERAKSIGGRLELWSEFRKGTEVEVTIPGAIAYRGNGDRRNSPDHETGTGESG